MNKQMDFQSLVATAMTSPGLSHMRPVVEKELLHYDLLFTLDKENLLDQLTFQGGTSLRLCYGAPRFSEDLDFVGGHDFVSEQLMDIKDCIEHYIGKRYELEVTVKTPSALKKQAEQQDLNVEKWQVAIVTSPEQKHLPKQRIKLEVANIPAYSREPRALQLNYDFLPEGYADTLIMTESLDEVMTDKLVSLVNCQRYVRHRDIWDLRWLKQQGAAVNMKWLANKLRDYGVMDYLGKADAMWRNLPEIIHGDAFKAEMTRFIPMEVQQRTLSKAKFYDHLSNEICGLLTNVKKALEGSAEDDEFRM
jgi:predicted nucleotidyltransferase component of viral defense system